MQAIIRRRWWLAPLALVAGISVAAAQSQPAPKDAAATAVATFAGGCFWCVESDFDKVEGVLSTVSGYMGGRTKNPTYKQVSAGGTGHAEVVQVTYDPGKVSYQRLLDVFWRTVDPLDAGGQFCDRGDQYRTAIFTHTEEQKRLAEASKAALDKSGRFQQKIATEVTPAGEFTPAEDYHQDFYKRNPVRYQYYRFGCGRDARVKALWGEEAGGKLVTQ
ncbi:MAG: peptide-methionine (S)-S-oxide reductase MsrA [Hyphomicrobiaceae bacterium]|nr:MAG: peptide-methionine (S)-S-oxide reductase MsrA [Hyphomicrobiaceae bacterium]